MMKKKPTFTRTDAHKKKRVGTGWRRPKGLQNKRRLRVKGYAPVVKVGYKNNKQTKGYSKNGLKQIMITNISQLEDVDKKTEAIIVSGKIGNKNRLPILEQAKKLGLVVLNLNVDKKITSIKTSVDEKKKKKEELQKKKVEKEKKAKKEKDKEKKKDAEGKTKAKDDKKEDAETDKDKEKKDFDKLLTTKDN